MRNLKRIVFAALAGIAGLATSAQADCWDPCNDDCCPDITVGVDWLYWTPCINDQHFAVTFQGEDPVFETKTHYLCDEWDSGVRVYAKLGNFWNGFNGALVYTYINPEISSSIEQVDSVLFSFPNPDSVMNLIGDSLSANWEMEYQTLDAILSYSIDVTHNRCLKIEAFSGLTWVDVTQKADYSLVNTNVEVPVALTINRHNDFWAIGPCFGLNTSLRICDCFNLFGMMKTSLVVGESDSKDVFIRTDTDGEITTVILNNTYTAKDECFCFPGLHLATGIDYELCVCDTTFGIRLGWEYVQWINAPTFPFYEQDEIGVRSATSTNDLTMQGIFVGLYSTF